MSGGSCEIGARISIDTTRSIWQGRRLRLRAIERDDWTIYFAWNQDDEMACNLYAVPFPQSIEAVKRWAEAEATRGPEGDAFRFVIENEEGEVVGDLTTHHCDARMGTLSYGLNIRRRDRRKGYAAGAIALVLRYYFDELRYQKVTVGVYEFNEASIRLHEKLGFQREGRIRRAVFTHGRFFDQFLFGLTVEEFKGGPTAGELPPAR